jgi:SAM-dependent methyltransferase
MGQLHGISGNVIVSGKDHYRRLYQTGLEEQNRWLEFGAGQKVDSVQLLMERNGIEAHSILELGAGTGAVIKECLRRGLGKHYAAVDYSPEAIAFLARSAPGVETVVADITGPEFSLDRSFDLIILSHVLEHLEEPDHFLMSLERLRWRYLVAEVPLEHLLAGRLKRLIKGEAPGREAGHVQFFTASTFENLLTANRLAIIDRRRYVPLSNLDMIRSMCSRNGGSRLNYLRNTLTAYYIPKCASSLSSRLYYAHYAALCRAAA